MGNVKRTYKRIDVFGTIATLIRERVQKIMRYTTSFNLGDFTSLDDIPNMRAVYAITSTAGLVPYPILIPTGSPVPFNIDFTDVALARYVNGFISRIELNTGDTTSQIIYDVVININYTTDDKTDIESIDVIGHSDFADPPLTSDDLILTLYA